MLRGGESIAMSVKAGIGRSRHSVRVAGCFQRNVQRNPAPTHHTNTRVTLREEAAKALLFRFLRSVSQDPDEKPVKAMRRGTDTTKAELKVLCIRQYHRKVATRGIASG
jgi:hypothetical protein